jgi:gas vesicle protein
MGRFIRGFVIGIIVGQFLAPIRGQEMRRLLSERIQRLFENFPDTMPAKQYTQQAVDRASPAVSDAKNNVQQGASSTWQNVQKNTSVAEDTFASQESKTQDDPLDRMESVSPEVREKLEAEGIQNTPQLLENAQTQAERAELAKQVGVSHRELREFVYRADLMRLTNLGEDVANVLEEAGIKGCKDLQNRNPEHLYSKLLNMQESGSIASPIPDMEQITSWIAEAKEMTQILKK